MQAQTRDNATVFLLSDNGERTEVGSWGLSPREALVCAVYQYIRNDFQTWNYETVWDKETLERKPQPLEFKETERLLIYPHGDNSTLFVHKHGLLVN